MKLTLVGVQDATARPHDLTQTFEILGVVFTLALSQQFFDASVENILRQYFEFAQFADEFNVAKHFTLRHSAAVILIIFFVIVRLFFKPRAIGRLENSGPTFEFELQRIAIIITNDASGIMFIITLTLHLLSSNLRKVHGSFIGSKLGASSASRLHNRAYIDEYLGSSRAFSNMRKITPFKMTLDCSSMRSRSSLSF